MDIAATVHSWHTAFYFQCGSVERTYTLQCWLVVSGCPHHTRSMLLLTFYEIHELKIMTSYANC